MNTLNKTIKSVAFTGLAMCIALVIAGLSTPVHSQTTNLLLNGDFEEGYSNFNGDSTVQVAAGWTPFWIIDDLDIPTNDTGKKPEYMASDAPQSPFARAYTGQRAQLWHTKFSTAFAGVYQRVPVTPGSTLQLSAWTYAWSSEGDNPTVSQNGAWARQRIGIDPTGGTDPNNPAIIWSLPSQYLDAWGRLSIETQAQADHVTVFLSAYPNRHLPQNDIYFDNASLSVVSFGLGSPTTGGEPLVAPTVDPLLTGLVTGQGVAPGTQGYDLTPDNAGGVSSAELEAVTAESAETEIASAADLEAETAAEETGVSSETVESVLRITGLLLGAGLFALIFLALGLGIVFLPRLRASSTSKPDSR